MIRTYKLLKDAPGCPVGETIKIDTEKSRGYTFYFSNEEIERNREWFEPIEEKSDEEILAHWLHDVYESCLYSSGETWRKFSKHLIDKGFDVGRIRE